MEEKELNEYKDTATLLSQMQARLKSVLVEVENIAKTLTIAQEKEALRLRKEQEAAYRLNTALNGLFSSKDVKVYEERKWGQMETYSMEDIEKEFDQVHTEVQNIELRTKRDYEEFRKQYLNRNGLIAQLFDRLKHVPASKRREYGNWVNRIKVQAQTLYDGINHE